MARKFELAAKVSVFTAKLGVLNLDMSEYGLSAFINLK